MKPFVILGSARPDGDTRSAVDIAFPDGGIELLILAHRHVGGYDYAHSNDGDDFQPAVEAMLKTDSIVFATPVYWYAMSAPLKFFFDRLTDLTETAKDKGRALADRRIWVIATGTDDALPEGFDVPFRRTAEYFAMRYCGGIYAYTGEDAARRATDAALLRAFGQRIIG